MNVTAIIPALDEEASIGTVVAGIDRGRVRDVVVGDNGSRDRTAERARAAGAEVVHVADRGYGAACAGALEYLADDVDVVLFIDADGSDDLNQVSSLLRPILEDEADLVIGSRTLGAVDPGAMTIPQRFGNWLAVRLIDRLYDFRYTDLGPFRAVRRDLLDRIAMRDRRYGWTVEMQIRAVQLGARIVEVPVRYRHRVGRSKISGTVRGIVLAGWGILSTIVRLRSRRSFAEGRQPGDADSV